MKTISKKRIEAVKLNWQSNICRLTIADRISNAKIKTCGKAVSLDKKIHIA